MPMRSGADEAPMAVPIVNARLRSAFQRARKGVARVRLSAFGEMQYQNLLNNLHEGVVFMDAHGLTLQCNPAAERILGMSAANLRARLQRDPSVALALKEDGTSFSPEEHPSQVALRTGEPCLEVTMGLVRENAPVLWISVNAVPMRGPDGHITGVVSSLVDITPLKRLQEKLQEEATHDPLTGLANRRHYLESLTKAFHSARRHRHPLAVAFCDLDHLKALNDAHGHAAGDRAIQAFGQVVAKALRREDLVARFGGDEFCVLFTHVGAEEARVCLNRVLEQVRMLELALPDGSRLRGFTASMGLANLGDAHAHPDDVLASADQALYQAKEAGRNQLIIL